MYTLFKNQDEVFVMMPPDSALHPFRAILCCAFGAKCLHVVDMVWSQARSARSHPATPCAHPATAWSGRRRATASSAQPACKPHVPSLQPCTQPATPNPDPDPDPNPNPNPNPHVSQAHHDVFFVDWEQPRGQQADEKLPNQVSVWRSVFAANEWVKLQTSRAVHVEFNLLFLLFLLRGMDQARY